MHSIIDGLHLSGMKKDFEAEAESEDKIELQLSDSTDDGENKDFGQDVLMILCGVESKLTGERRDCDDDDESKGASAVDG